MASKTPVAGVFLVGAELEAVARCIRSRLDYLNLLENAGASGRVFADVERERAELRPLLERCKGVMRPA